MVFAKEQRHFNGKRLVFSSYGTEKKETSTCKNNNQDIDFTFLQGLTQIRSQI